MAKKQVKQKHKGQVEEFEQVDVYLIPKSHAEMYKVLRNAVAEDIIDYFESHQYQVQMISDQELGEGIQGKSPIDDKEVIIYLSPNNVSLAQKARDKDQIDKFIESFFK